MTDQLSVDVAELKIIGTYHIPSIANLHYDAALKLDSVEYLRPQLFLTPGNNDAGQKSVAYGPWLELYALAQRILHDTTVNLADIADGVVKAAEAYYSSDLTTKQQLETDDLLRVYEVGDSAGHEGGMGSPPDNVNPDDVPGPNPTPSDDQIYDANDGASGVDEGDLVSTEGVEEQK